MIVAKATTGNQMEGVAAVCEDWTAAEQEKKRLLDVVPGFNYHLIEKTVTRRLNSNP